MSVTIRRKVVTLLDRPGGRRLLATAATHWARFLTNDQNLSIIYDDMWIDVVDQTYIPRSSAFSYYAFDLQSMRRLATNALSASLDYWTHIYCPQPGDTVIDAGAGIGIDSLVLSPLVGSSGCIYSVEAHPWTFNALLKTCELNRLTNVIPLQYALSDEPGQLWISDLPGNEQNYVSNVGSDDCGISVPAIDLDTLIDSKGIRRVALLKMNIEGAERLVINGMDRYIGQIDHVAIACHDFLGNSFRTREPVIAFLRDSGFDIIERRGDPRPYVRDHIHGVRRKS